MLIPLVARMAGAFGPDNDPYSAWASALRALRADFARSHAISIERLACYLDQVPSQQRHEAMLDLVTEHLRLTWAVGRGPLVEQYIPVLSQYADGMANPGPLPPELVEEEFIARHSLPHGDAPAVGHYFQRFPGRSDIERALQRRELGDGRFVKLAMLGRGGSGEVWEAFDRRQNTLVALKLPRDDLANLQQVLDCFRREARVTADLSHPGIINLRECRAGDVETFYVMTRVNGRRLSDEIRDYHQPPATRTARDQQCVLTRLLERLAAACDVLQHAHDRGIVHCDLKPANIAVDNDGGAAVLDWGLVQRNAPLLPADAAVGAAQACRQAADAQLPERQDDDRGVLGGTPNYMAPEQLHGTVDARTDVFGLGATLYEILAGRAPHSWGDGCTPADWRRQVEEARFARPRRWNAAASRKLENICLKALARDPGRRQPSAAALAADLRSYLTDCRSGSGVGLFGRVRQWFPRGE